jgi:hypothetical protein
VTPWHVMTADDILNGDVPVRCTMSKSLSKASARSYDMKGPSNILYEMSTIALTELEPTETVKLQWSMGTKSAAF